MFAIIGIVVVFGAIVAGYLMEKGNLLVLLQPAELIIIGGAALGTLLIANPQHSINAGAIFEDSEVVVDWNMVTSRKPEDLPAFCRASIKVLAAGPVFDHSSGDHRVCDRLRLPDLDRGRSLRLSHPAIGDPYPAIHFSVDSLSTHRHFSVAGSLLLSGNNCEKKKKILP